VKKGYKRNYRNNHVEEKRHLYILLFNKINNYFE